MVTFKQLSFSLITGLFLSACSGNMPLLNEDQKVPSWYLNAPLNNSLFIYGEGESRVSIGDAKNNALNTMASKLVVNVGSSISSITETSQNSYQKDIRKKVDVDVQKISFTNATVEKSIQLNGSFYVLMKVNREELFKNKKKEFDIRDKRIDTKYSSIHQYGKLEQIHILQILKPIINKAKTQAITLNAINNDFDHSVFISKYDSYTDKIMHLKEMLIISVKSNKSSRYFADELTNILNKEQYRVTSQEKSNITISLDNKIKYSIARGWNIAKVSTTVFVKSNSKIISTNIIQSLGRSSTSKQSALENASIHFSEQIEEMNLDKVIFSK